MEKPLGLRKNELTHTFERSTPNGTRKAYHKPDGIATGDALENRTQCSTCWNGSAINSWKQKYHSSWERQRTKHSNGREGYRSGYRPRRLDTRMGTMYLLVPKARNGGYIPFFITERKTK